MKLPENDRVVIPVEIRRGWAPRHEFVMEALEPDSGVPTRIRCIKPDR